MLEKIRAWLQERRRKQAAIERALRKFHEKRGIVAMGYALSQIRNGQSYASCI